MICYAGIITISSIKRRLTISRQTFLNLIAWNTERRLVLHLYSLQVLYNINKEMSIILANSIYCFLISTQCLALFIQLGYISYLIFGLIPITTAMAFKEFNKNFIVNIWTYIVLSPFCTKIFFTILIPILIISAIVIILKGIGGIKLILILSIANFIITFIILFLIYNMHASFLNLSSSLFYLCHKVG